MADFSKEYQQKYFPGMGWDFSIKSLFARLKEGEMKPEICEGYGFKAIARENGKCILMYSMVMRLSLANWMTTFVKRGYCLMIKNHIIIQ
jgi:hypothetical protein